VRDVRVPILVEGKRIVVGGREDGNERVRFGPRA
jgi:hypothetical protein